MKSIPVYVCTNFRFVPIISIIHSCLRNTRNGSRPLVLCSDIWLSSSNWGENLPNTYKRIGLFLLSLTSKVVIVNRSKTTALPDKYNLGIQSTMKSITCDSLANSRNYPKLYANYVQLAMGAMDVIEHIKAISSKSRVKLFIFNGRGANQYPIALFAFENDLQLNYFEYGLNSFSGYKLFPFAPHNTKRFGEELVNEYSRLSLNSRKNLELLGDQKIRNNLLNSFEKRLRASNLSYEVVVFLGSDHEYTSLNEGISGYKHVSNLVLTEYAIKKYSGSNSMAIRAHPNEVIDRSVQEISSKVERLCFSYGVNYIPGCSSISSHDLIRKAKVVVVAYSSIAYDAIHLGKPVDILGDLALKILLQNAHRFNIESDPVSISRYIASMQLIEPNLFYIRFPLVLTLLLRVLIHFEARLYKKDELS